MPFIYKKVLVIGATSGIGEALASRLVQEGASVIVCGRRKERLEAFVHKHGKDKASAVPFDITELDKLPAFVTKLYYQDPYRPRLRLHELWYSVRARLSKPESVDLDSIQTEFTTNYLAYLALTKAFLPFLQSKKAESGLIFTTSGLALVPMKRCGNYCASKAALHHWILVLREQLRDSKVKVIELFPPAVQTELHDSKHQPDIQNGHSIGMPLDAFTDEAYEGLNAGKEEVVVGMAKGWYDAFEPQRQAKYHQMLGS